MLNPKMTALKSLPLEQVLIKIIDARNNDNIWTINTPEDVIEVENNTWKSLKKHESGEGAISLLQYWLYYHPEYLNTPYEQIAKKSIDLLIENFSVQLKAMNALTNFNSQDTSNIYGRIDKIRKDVMDGFNTLEHKIKKD